MAWDIHIPNLEDLVFLTNEKLLSPLIVSQFINQIHIVSNSNGKIGNRNIGFPLCHPGSKEIVGYQLDNYGFTDVIKVSSDNVGSWNINFEGLPENINNLYLFVDAIDLMSFCEIYSRKVNFQNSAFSRIDRNITDTELSYIVNFFPRARIHACFDCDRHGSMLDIRTVALQSGEAVGFQQIGNLVNFEWQQKIYQVNSQDFNFTNFRALTNIRTKVKVLKAHRALNFNSQLIRLKRDPKTIFQIQHEKV
jgi:hypothetical protein